MLSQGEEKLKWLQNDSPAAASSEKQTEEVYCTVSSLQQQDLPVLYTGLSDRIKGRQNQQAN